MGTFRSALATLRAQRRSVGLGAALSERLCSRLRHSPGFEADRERIAVAEDEVATAARRIDELLAGQSAVERERGATSARIEQTSQSSRAQLDELLTRMQRADTALRSMHGALVSSLWLTNAPLAIHPLVSIIVPTAFPDRLDYLQSAIASVVAQSYPNWELIVVDDSPDGYVSSDAPWWPEDVRVRLVRSQARNGGGARAVGLARSSGELVAYLDDDCRYFPWWMHAAVASFESSPELDYIYGMRLVEGQGKPWMYSEPFDPVVLHEINPVDTNVLVHRRSAEFEWPTDRSSCSDYLAVVNVSSGSWSHVTVPAATYSERAPHRIWQPDRVRGNLASLREVRSHMRSRRPLRVVAHNPLYPLNTETYIGDELIALQREGFDIVMSRQRSTVHPTERMPDLRLFEDFDEAMAQHDPDLVLFHWASNAIAMRERAAAHNVPYAVRTHSFDQPRIAEASNHPSCIGVWQVSDAGRVGNTRLLPTLIDGSYPMGSEHRSPSVITASACLPKRGIDDVLLPALAQLPETVCRTIILGGTDEFEDLLARVTVAHDPVHNLIVRTNVAHDEVQTAFRESAVAVYPVRHGQALGQPRSVIEAALAGCDLVLPDAPVIRGMVDDHGYFYEAGNPASLRRAVELALAEPSPWTTRQELARRIWQRHSVDSHRLEWAESLILALVEWRRLNPRDPDGLISRWWWHGY